MRKKDKNKGTSLRTVWGDGLKSRDALPPQEAIPGGVIHTGLYTARFPLSHLFGS